MQRTQDEIAFKYVFYLFNWFHSCQLYLWQPPMLNRSPFSRRGHEGTYTPSVTDSDISFVSSGRQSVDRMLPSFYDMDVPRLSVSSEYEANRCSFATSSSSDKQSIDLGSSYTAFSSSSLESGRTSCSLQSQVSTQTTLPTRTKSVFIYLNI